MDAREEYMRNLAHYKDGCDMIITNTPGKYGCFNRVYICVASIINSKQSLYSAFCSQFKPGQQLSVATEFL